MNEDKSISINVKFSTIIIAIITTATIIIIALMIIIYNMHKKVITLENAEYEEDDIDYYDDYLDTEEYFDTLKATNKYIYNDNEVDKFSIEEIRDSINNYLKIYAMYNESQNLLLLKLGLTTKNKIEINSKKPNIGEYHSTEIEFKEYKNEMLNYMTEDCFLNRFCDTIRSADGILYYSLMGSYENITDYEIIDIKKSENEVNTYDTKIKYNFGQIYYVDKGYSSSNNENDFYFVITSQNEKPIVEYTNI